MRLRIIETTGRPPSGTVRNAIVLYPIAPGEYDVVMFDDDGTKAVTWREHGVDRRGALQRAREIRDAMCWGESA